MLVGWINPSWSMWMQWQLDSWVQRFQENKFLLWRHKGAIVFNWCPTGNFDKLPGQFPFFEALQMTESTPLWQTCIDYSPLEKDFKTDANRARAFRGEFSLWCKRFVNVHLHCNVSNLKKISKMSTLSRLENILQTPVATFTFSASFHVWANQANLTV